MLSITLTLHGTLQHSMPTRQKTVLVEVEVPSSPRELLERTGVPVEIVSMLYLNGEKVQMDATVRPGDELEAFPFLCGG